MSQNYSEEDEFKNYTLQCSKRNSFQALQQLVSLSMYEETTKNINSQMSTFQKQISDLSSTTNSLISKQNDLSSQLSSFKSSITNEITPLTAEYNDTQKTLFLLGKSFVNDMLVNSPTHCIDNYTMNKALIGYAHHIDINITFRQVKHILSLQNIVYKNTTGNIYCYMNVSFKNNKMETTELEKNPYNSNPNSNYEPIPAIKSTLTLTPNPSSSPSFLTNQQKLSPLPEYTGIKTPQATPYNKHGVASPAPLINGK